MIFVQHLSVAGCVYRDYEYKRLGTLSLIAGIDLLTGKAIPVVSETHKSSDFICLLEKLDAVYPKGALSELSATITLPTNPKK